MSGLYLQRVDDTTAAVAALTARWGDPVGLDGVRRDLGRRLRTTWAPGRAVERAWRFDGRDQRDLRWWPQGVSTAADAGREESRLALVSWYAKKQPWHDAHHGSRVSVLDLDALRYRHVLLVVPTAAGGVEPLRIHAGGIVWYGDHLHVAATGKGFFTCHLDDVVRVPDGAAAATFGYRYVLPVRLRYQARTDEGVERFRYSFLSLDRAPMPSGPPAILAGEYTNDPARTRRLARFPVDPGTGLLETGDDDRAALTLLGDGPRRMQGVVAARDRLHVTVSQGRFVRGSVFAGAPHDLREHRHATPMGNEDIAYWPQQDLLYSVSEHPTARWLFAMRRSWFD